MKKDKELEALIDQVFNQGKNRRVFQTMDAKSYLNQSSRNADQEPAVSDSSTQTLLETLKRQNEDLKKMSEENLGFSEADYQKLQQEILRDFGCTLDEEAPKQTNQSLDAVRASFAGLEDTLNSEIFGQKNFIHQLCMAFQRPYVIGIDPALPKGSMIIAGNEGTGRHSALSRLTSLLHERGVFADGTVASMDLSLYPSKDQEGLFLQDLYMNLKSPAEVLGFENAEKCFPVFLEVLSDLTVKGTAQLSKRYGANAQGQLVEAQNGLLKEAVSSFSAAGKFLVFFTEGSANRLIQAFGTDFMNAIKDRLISEPLGKEALAEIFNRELLRLVDRCQNQLQITLTLDDSWRPWCLQQMEPKRGAKSLIELIDAVIEALAEIRMENLEKNDLAVCLSAKPDATIEVLGQQRRLSDFMEKESAADLDAVKKQLDEIVGLREIKRYVLSLEDHVQVQKLRQRKGLKTTELNKHMIFTGNPGTGKTTIARLVAQLFKAMGVLSGGQLVEVTRADLVGRYVGHTAPLTMQVIKSALGGVLFIDEAYSLYRGKEDSFGLEAIDTLVKGMEDYRDDLVVILAGYSREMKEFLDANSGLKSRFPNVIEFPDYTADELTAIAQSIAKGKEYHIDEACLTPLHDYFERKQKEDARANGNGRLARNLIEQAILNQSGRILADANQPMDRLILKDFDLNG